MTLTLSAEAVTVNMAHENTLDKQIFAHMQVAAGQRCQTPIRAEDDNHLPAGVDITPTNDKLPLHNKTKIMLRKKCSVSLRNPETKRNTDVPLWL